MMQKRLSIRPKALFSDRQVPFSPKSLPSPLTTVLMGDDDRANGDYDRPRSDCDRANL